MAHMSVTYYSGSLAIIKARVQETTNYDGVMSVSAFMNHYSCNRSHARNS